MSTALLVGASGLVGRELLAQLLDGGVTVHAPLRRAVADLPGSALLHPMLIDFAHPPALPQVDALYIALGTTIKVAGSEAAFRAVDFDAVLSIAKAARGAGVKRCAVISALGADGQSSVFYNRVKGEMEAAMSTLGFDRLVIARPSLLGGARKALNQTPRWGEQLSLKLLAPVSGLIPLAWRPIQAAVVARALLRTLPNAGPAVQVLESAQLQTLGKESR
jgi:uncharacterized protein YbjT (DUF2867 family)